ncbi:hypothetical protein [Actinorugispora endophytica]|uniref:Uncharacterized protein n=1 Tax=Actinorugispora endophytica TaxID=1605990 RepID=A0A4R6V7N5_9ACTN|nr:hypothetical protein [Actinorugispora endophytica]TDQ55126.1 hypothetical protein EV190_101449 [Actinorugispora endophytica]
MSGAFDGAIVLGLLVLFVILGIRWLRKRVQIPWTTSGLVLFFVVLVLLLWAYQTTT